MRLHAGNKAVVIAALTLLLAAPVATADTDEKAVFKGEARSKSNGDLYYTEHHEQQGHCEGGKWRIREHKVEYKDTDGELIARKTLDYSESPQRPTYVIEDLRFDEKMAVTNKDDRKLEIRWRTPDGDNKAFDPSIPSNGVVDAGFEAVAQENWEALVEDGEAKRIEFLASTRGDFYRFDVSRVDRADELEGDHAFRIRSRGWVTRWFVDEIILGYSDDRRLTDYVGVTNIRKDKDDNYDAHIRYHYDQWPDCASRG